MFSIKTLFFSHQQAAPANDQPETPRDTIVREDFTWDTDQMTASEIIAKLRQQTVDFSFNNLTTWAVTDLNYNGVEIRCKLTKAQDIVFSINGKRVANPAQAVEIVQDYAVQF